MLILLVVVVVSIFVSMEWSNKNCGAVSEIRRYLSSVWFPNYILSGSQYALRTKSVPQSDVIFFPLRTQSREHQDGNFCFQQ